MKKSFILAAFMVVLGATMAYAQPRAIGGRLGAFDGVSYEHGIGDNNMIEVELGWAYTGYVNGTTNNQSWHAWGQSIQAAATYDWIDPFGATFPWSHKGEWHWYMGVGAAGGYGWKSWTNVAGTGAYGADLNWGFVAAAGRVGVEYDFWFPLQLSIDYRPTLGLGLLDNKNGGAEAGFYWEVTSIALGVRYKF